MVTIRGALTLENWEVESMGVMPRLLSHLFGKDFSCFWGIRCVGRWHAFFGNGAFNARTTRFLINVGYLGRWFWYALNPTALLLLPMPINRQLWFPISCILLHDYSLRKKTEPPWHYSPQVCLLPSASLALTGGSTMASKGFGMGFRKWWLLLWWGPRSR